MDSSSGSKNLKEYYQHFGIDEQYFIQKEHEEVLLMNQASLEWMRFIDPRTNKPRAVQVWVTHELGTYKRTVHPWRFFKGIYGKDIGTRLYHACYHGPISIDILKSSQTLERYMTKYNFEVPYFPKKITITDLINLYREVIKQDGIHGLISAPCFYHNMTNDPSLKQLTLPLPKYSTEEVNARAAAERAAMGIKSFPFEVTLDRAPFAPRKATLHVWVDVEQMMATVHAAELLELVFFKEMGRFLYMNFAKQAYGETCVVSIPIGYAFEDLLKCWDFNIAPDWKSLYLDPFLRSGDLSIALLPSLEKGMSEVASGHVYYMFDCLLSPSDHANEEEETIRESIYELELSWNRKKTIMANIYREARNWPLRRSKVTFDEEFREFLLACKKRPSKSRSSTAGQSQH
jgi:hypothetical protein